MSATKERICPTCHADLSRVATCGICGKVRLAETCTVDPSVFRAMRRTQQALALYEREP